jgi:hypothetical protein
LGEHFSRTHGERKIGPAGLALQSRFLHYYLVSKRKVIAIKSHLFSQEIFFDNQAPAFEPIEVIQ